MSLIRADARALPLRDGCVSCVVTSPPYWGLRSYPDARQMGLEATPSAYVAALVAVFREVWRVLRDDGTVWLNIGDSYAGSGPSGASYESATTIRRATLTHDGAFAVSKTLGARGLSYAEKKPIPPPGLKSKDLIGIPWRVAFALQADGWYLRSDIIWAKPNPMPESVTDRPTKAHEYLFLLAKSERYYYDAAAIREPWTCDRDDMRDKGVRTGLNYLQQGPAPPNDSTHPLYQKPYKGTGRKAYAAAGVQDPSAVKARIVEAMLDGTLTGRNKRSVWTIATMPYAGAHFATFPEAVVEPCLLAGCPLGGRVLDPFCGTGTVGAVAERLGRRWVGVDLTYQHLARARTAQRGLQFAEEPVA